MSIKLRLFLLPVLSLLCVVSASGQSSVALPYTMTTLAGGLVQTTYTAGTTYCPGSGTVKATTAYGDNCPAVGANFGAAGRGGVAVDQYGNVFVADDINKVAHMIDASTGVMTLLAGGNSACTGKVDSEGDGCLAASNTTFSSGIRGIGIDPYGNVLLAGYGDSAIHMICRYASPLCTVAAPAPTASAPIQIQVGYMGIVAGCVAGASGAGTTGTGVDNTPGFSTLNSTATNSASYPAALSGSASAFKNAGSCTTALGETSQPRGVTADLYGNIYYADTGTSRTRVVLGPLTSSFFSGNNPLYAALGSNSPWSSPVAGYVYTVVNPAGTGTSTGGSASTAGSACAASLTVNSAKYSYSGSARATNIRGDGCPWFDSSVNASSGNTVGVAVDAAGNMIFTDPGNGSATYGGVRVLFVQGWATAALAANAGASGSVATAGVAMYKAIVANNAGVTPTAGFIYNLIGNAGLQATASGNTIGTTPYLGSSIKISDALYRLTVSPQGNIYIGDNTRVLFFDINSGYARVLLQSSGAASTVGSACNSSSTAIARSSFGDGCPASAAGSSAEFGNGNGSLSVAVDGQGNLYMYDASSYGGGMLVRKVLAQGMGTQPVSTLNALTSTASVAAPLQALGVTQTQTFQAHFLSATAASATVTSSTNASLSLATPVCGSLNADGSLDCTVKGTILPTASGNQSGSFILTAAGGASVSFTLGNSVSGSVLAIDNASAAGTAMSTTAALFNGYAPTSVAVDSAGNVYAGILNGSSYSIVESVAGSPSGTVTAASGLTAAPTALTVDGAGNIYYLNGGSAIQVLTPTVVNSALTYTAGTLAYTTSTLAAADPVALAVDGAGNLLVADNQNGTDSIYKLSPAALAVNSQANCSYAAAASVLPSLCQTTVYSAGAFGTISALAVDANGNVLVADTSKSAVFELTPTLSAGLYTMAKSTRAANVTATGLATDAGGDLYVQSSNGITMYPISGPSGAGVPVYGAAATPVGVAVDAQGNVYDADSANTFLTRIQRNAALMNFASSTTTEFQATLTNIGNQTSSTQTATATTGAAAGDFTLSGGSSYGCSFNSNNLLTAMTAGESCSMTALFPALGVTQDTDYIAFAPTSPATSTAGVLELTGLADTEAYDTTMTIGSQSPSAPVYAVSGTEVSFPVTVTATALSVSGDGATTAVGPATSQYVSVSVDGGASTNYNFTVASGLSASVTLNLSGLTAGAHTLTVTFPQQGVFLKSSASYSPLTVQQQGTTVSWNPGTTAQQVSAAIGASVLNAAEASGVAGSAIYSTTGYLSCATNNGSTVDASTYLPIGSYTIYATFCPADGTDYSSSQASISYTVTQASTTAALGASTMVVAPSGGNYTSLTAALQALPVTGGTIYLAPGSYSGQNVISYPNVHLRGLGGDATQVILTAANGDFNSTSAALMGSPFSLGPAGKGSDEGSATLDVSKNAFIGASATSATYTPNNFYAEYLTIQNTFNTDPVTTSTVTASSNGGTCSAGSTAHTLQYLYNNNQECGAQALALFLNSDGAVLNNVNLLSQQDTLYASSIGCGTYCTVAREYMWNGLIAGDVDYTFGDAALVFDHTNFFTTWHGTTAAGQETITAQNKRYATGTTATTVSTYPTSSDYLSGFICNGCTLMSQSAGMSNLYYGRPYDISTSSYPSSYSTWIMLNSWVDQVNPKGWIGWDGNVEYLSTSTYGEYNTMAYTDPAAGTAPYPYSIFNSTPSLLYAADASGSTSNSISAANTTGYLELTANNTGSGVTSMSSRESWAIDLTAADAAQYYPVNFLSTTVPSTKLSTGQPASWNPVSALASLVNGFAPVSSVGALTYGSSVTILGRPQTPGAGVIPTGAYTFFDSLNVNQSCTAASGSCTTLSSGTLDKSGEAYLTTSSLASGLHYITMVYGGDSNFTGSTSGIYTIEVLQPGQSASTTTLRVANSSTTTGGTFTGSVAVAPGAATGTISIYMDGSVAASCVLTGGSCAWSIAGAVNGSHSLYALYPGDTNYGLSQSAAITATVVSPAATGDTRSVTEPSFPAVCQQLSAALSTDASIQDLDAGVDATLSNIDGSRIQSALNACSATAVAAGSQLAVELSMDSTGAYNAFLSGPLSMPSNVTLLVDPNVTLYFSRNVQDYDIVPGTHTCGTINSATATKSCLPLIEVPGSSTNVGIMGFGKLNGRGNDALLNTFTTSGYAMPSTPSWWNLASQANGEGNQQNPRFVQLDTGASNITLYRITLLNAPMFHVSTTGAVSNLTAWDIKIVTPTSARNTDGVDPANVQNATIAYSWISDGDDNVAVSAPGTGTKNVAANISVTNNHFYAGHGESIGSYTGAGVSNILFDGNMSAGDAWAGAGSAVLSGTNDGNSTAIRIKSANDRGGIVTGIQYSNSCFLDHKTDIQITPYYSSGDSTSLFPNYNGILMQNLTFVNDASSQGSVELTGEYNTNSGSAVDNPLQLTMDNVTFPSTLSALVNSTAAVESSASSSAWGTNVSGGTGEYTTLTVGPGQVSGNLLTAFNALAAVGVNNDALINNINGQSVLDAPSCVFTYLAPELTGPNGVAQTVGFGNSATVDVILTPTVSALNGNTVSTTYPTGTVTVTDTTTNTAFAATLSGSGDTLQVAIPASDLTLGTHTFTATYAGDSNFTVPASYQTFGAYNVTVTQGAPVISAWPSASSITYGQTLANSTLSGGAASVAGTFSWSAPSTAPTAGSANYTVIFTPTDSTDYISVSGSVSVTTNAAVPNVSSWPIAAGISYGQTLANSALSGGVASNPNNAAVVAGVFTWTTSTIAPNAGTASYGVTFTPSDTANYLPVTGVVPVLTSKATPTVSWQTPSAITYGTALSAAQLNAALSVAGNCSYSPAQGTVLSAGAQTLTANCTPGDVNDYNTPAASTVQVTVNAAALSVTANSYSISYGSAIPALTGTLTGVVNGDNITASYSTTAVTASAVGSYAVTATLLDPNSRLSNYTVTNTPGTLTITSAAAAVSLSGLSQTYTGSALAATVATVPSGLAVVTTYNGSAAAPVAAGSYTVVATINNVDYTGSATGTMNIARAASSIAFTLPPAQLVTGVAEKITVSVTGTGTLTGSASIATPGGTLCTITLSSGAGSCIFTPSTPGNLTLTAQYGGDANHLASGSTQTVEVYDSAVVLQASSTQLVYPGATNLTACIQSRAAAATGTVLILDGSTQIASLPVQGGGCAYWYIAPGLSAGAHTLTAVYSGDRNNVAGTSTPVVLNVAPAPVTLSAACWNSVFAYGQNYQCTVNVSSPAGAPAGVITYSVDGGAAVALPLSYGNAQFTVTKPAPGAHTVAIGFARQGNYAAANTQTENFTVTAAPIVFSLTPSSWYTKASGGIGFTVSIASWSAGPPNGIGAVSFYDGNTLLATVPVNGAGSATFSTTALAPGSHTINASFAGAPGYASGSGNVTITLTQ